MTTENAVAVLRLLQAAGLEAPFGADMADAERLWGARLAGYDLETLMDAVDVWTRNPNAGWPTVAQFEAVVRHQRPELAACRTCRGERYLNAGERAVRPCPTCNDRPVVQRPRQPITIAEPAQIGAAIAHLRDGLARMKWADDETTREEGSDD